MVYKEVVNRVVGLLDKVKVPYVIVGALATGYYGLARSTRDVDVLIFSDEKMLKRLVSRARKAKFMLVSGAESAVGALTLEAREGYRVDIWKAGKDHDILAIDRRKKRSLLGVRAWMVSPEDLILQKVWMGRPLDIMDAAAVMVRQKGKLDVKYMRKWARELGKADVFNELAGKVW
jgi:hypothetical protein